MTNPTGICQICGEGHLSALVEINPVEYKGVSKELDMYCSICSVCGSEQASANDVRTNKRAMMAFKKEVDGLLTGVQVRALRDKFGINQTYASLIFGGGPVAFSKYESDDVAQSEAMDKLLRLADAVPAAYAHLAKQAGIIQPQSESMSKNWKSADWASEPDVTPVRRAPHLRIVSVSEPVPEQQRRYA
ncbi:type II toxin-antitoxin system MqsA family antitoxin [Gallionella capsiferriformans]|uniref:Zinc finger/helix-turn-helix protein, YgiT family n=1 Tax=Gallionella capsiferriformans (strain ES-2) TaxID=395494 RepID=D9SDK9_GALCS|nr:type II toxin-antitoxin system MqsA family antitoxin [Gallionella capsiferriformans]ADL54766.1 hypothetical protein Galf_0728 [Gallionella capsiferriformans ES-2]